ncbi:uncharacterized protein KQ657_003768 [Scheffersomyces spartinae]|uniref:Uncharacterized protein n=1 Tax=Scheffersomyces spartinae TaxID=45513 RepID=A0A9P8AKL1_9ASCO|nr:uncharacterized protein KQ657_003768 [Scheffersomyces spartinae]KAG7195242.1 hypothetical protein KQ657_003768 [Scheffersomyces spartinae]
MFSSNTPNLSLPTAFAAKSLVLAATPSVLPHLFPIIENIHSQGIQVLVAGVDTIPLNNRNGVSELWLNEKLEIKSPEDESKDHSHSHSDLSSVHKLNNWESTKGSLRININDNSVVDMQLANTLFSTGHDHTLFYLDSSRRGSGELTDQLEVILPLGLVKEEKAAVTDRWTPLYEGQTFTITNCVGNLLKQVDGKGASSYLEKSKLLMDLGSKDTQVYVKIHRKAGNYKTILRYEVIAGGGGWGAKADIIALTPHATISKGDKIEFFMLTPSDRYSSDSQSLRNSLDNSIVIECSQEEVSYNNGATGDDASTLSYFGCGSEKGFTYKGVGHASSGEKLAFALN